ncbi:MAG: hypothetical protein ACFE8L_05075 [Candidatus Hodarchaeota archaeon]
MSKAVSSKSISFYDWELTFKKRTKNNLNIENKEINSLGLSDESFKDFMTEWKKKNLI